MKTMMMLTLMTATMIMLHTLPYAAQLRVWTNDGPEYTCNAKGKERRYDDLS